MSETDEKEEQNKKTKMTRAQRKKKFKIKTIENFVCIFITLTDEFIASYFIRWCYSSLYFIIATLLMCICIRH